MLSNSQIRLAGRKKKNKNHSSIPFLHTLPSVKNEYCKTFLGRKKESGFLINSTLLFKEETDIQHKKRKLVLRYEIMCEILSWCKPAVLSLPRGCNANLYQLRI